MSRYTNLVLVLSLAACERGGTPHAQHPPDLRAKAPAPVAEPQLTQPETPAIAPPIEEPPAVKPEPAAVAPTPAPKLKKKCIPQSRAGCRWNEERDERDVPRVTKRPVAPAGTP
jgi:hypothetical protein